MKWIMQGNRGLTYVRVMRTDSAVLYSGDYTFSFNKGHKLREDEKDQAVIISSGRGVHEALAASEICKKRGLSVGVVDMPSMDDELLRQLHASNKLLIFAEQNNGYLWQTFLKVLYGSKGKPGLNGLPRVIAINTLNAEGKPQFIHSATYEELIAAFGLTPSAIADSIESNLADKEVIREIHLKRSQKYNEEAAAHAGNPAPSCSRATSFSVVTGVSPSRRASASNASIWRREKAW